MGRHRGGAFSHGMGVNKSLLGHSKYFVHQRLLAGFRSHVDEQGVLEEGSVQLLPGIERGNR